MASPAASRWWHRLGDPELPRLVEQALSGNPDVEQVAARLDQARASAAAVRAALRPQLGASASAAAQQQSLEDPAIRPFASLPGFPREQARYSAGLSASWEIDLFGGSARRRSARAEAEAAAADLAAARVAIAAETASAWLTVRELQARRSLAAALLDVLSAQAEMVDTRMKAGVAAPLELDQLVARRAAQAGALAALDGLIAAEVEGLGVLVGNAQAARAAALSHALRPFQPEMPAVGRLAVSIAARPDVIAAQRRLVAADAALGAARAQRLPRVSLAGLLASIASGPAALFTGAAETRQGSAALSLPLLDFGRIDAAIAGARGSRRAALAAVRKAELTAAADVGRSAALLHARRTTLGAAQQASGALAAARTRIGRAHEQGVVDRVAVLEIEQSRLSAEDSLVSSRAEAMKALVAVFRATADMEGS